MRENLKHTIMKITSIEFEAYQGTGNYVLSDIDYGYNTENGKYDVPAIEWDSFYGTHWSYYESEDARQNALDTYELDMERWVLGYRVEQVKINVEKGKKAKALRESKTLGGQFPILTELLIASRI
jgi:hypothetical protein